MSVVTLGLSMAMYFAVAVAHASASEPAYVPPEPGVSEPALPESLTSCPVPPEPAEGGEQAAVEVRALRIDLAESCEALSRRLVLSLERSWWIVAEAVKAGKGQQKIVELLEAESSAVAGTLAVNVAGPNPLPVEVAGTAESLPVGTVEDPKAYEHIDAIGEATRNPLWMMIGIFFCSLVIVGIWKAWDRAS